ncbi:spermidine/putrescine ABC transporter ATP-binding protein [Paenibacillus agaridevorans]|uniref:Spermidine/putrescine ABC transporter ATP-binding protein n=2 Tax=Paenibacillus TaxID=44249 RepID=A0A2R5EYX7_9BACL|nr:ABC transporter ATP-binding protein [Paenibacillus agaridevorans]GBG11916.1 spermidine/putrescine ABC transporter ATP-binding protein [Paenibacillus agaridevorans]
MNEPVMSLKDVSHVYVNDKGASLALENIHLDIAPGEFVSLVGPSGCGKTTLLSLLAGLFPPTLGSVTVGGRSVQGPSPAVGYMLQQDFLFPWRTIRDNAAIGLEIAGRRNEKTMAAVDHWLGELGLEGNGGRYPHELSGGMRQRVALARTLVTEPDVLLLDEPFSALDLHIKLQLEDLVQHTLARLGKTAVLVTHDLAEAAAMSDRVIVLGKGPGHIRREVSIAEPIRQAPPTEARRMAQFQSVFDQLWAEFNDGDGKGGDQHG